MVNIFKKLMEDPISPEELKKRKEIVKSKEQEKEFLKNEDNQKLLYISEMATEIYKKLAKYNYIYNTSKTDIDDDLYVWSLCYSGYNLVIKSIGRYDKSTKGIRIEYEKKEVLVDYSYCDAYGVWHRGNCKYVPGSWEKIIKALYDNIDDLYMVKHEEDLIEEKKYKLYDKFTDYIHKTIYSFNKSIFNKNCEKLNSLLEKDNIIFEKKIGYDKYIACGEDCFSEYNIYTIYQNNEKVFEMSNGKKSHPIHFNKDVSIFKDGPWINKLETAFIILDAENELKLQEIENKKNQKIDDIVKSLYKSNKYYK